MNIPENHTLPTHFGRMPEALERTSITLLIGFLAEKGIKNPDITINYGHPEAFYITVLVPEHWNDIVGRFTPSRGFRIPVAVEPMTNHLIESVQWLADALACEFYGYFSDAA